jgi:hypothetical protein
VVRALDDVKVMFDDRVAVHGQDLEDVQELLHVLEVEPRSRGSSRMLTVRPVVRLSSLESFTRCVSTAESVRCRGVLTHGKRR